MKKCSVGLRTVKTQGTVPDRRVDHQRLRDRHLYKEHRPHWISDKGDNSFLEPHRRSQKNRWCVLLVKSQLLVTCPNLLCYINSSQTTGRPGTTCHRLRTTFRGPRTFPERGGGSCHNARHPGCDREHSSCVLTYFPRFPLFTSVSFTRSVSYPHLLSLVETFYEAVFV